MSANYNEIRNYIYEKHGKRVSNKWIAEVKRECGMLVFSTDNEIYEPTYPKLAKKYIIEAFEHFDMLDERPVMKIEE